MNTKLDLNEEKDVTELLMDLDGSEIKRIFDKHCKRSKENKQVENLLEKDFEANYDEAEQIMIKSIKKYISFDRLEEIIDEVDY